MQQNINQIQRLQKGKWEEIQERKDDHQHRHLESHHLPQRGHHHHLPHPQALTIERGNQYRTSIFLGKQEMLGEKVDEGMREGDTGGTRLNNYYFIQHRSSNHSSRDRDHKIR